MLKKLYAKETLHLQGEHSTVADYYILSDISNSDIRPQIWNSQPRVWVWIRRLVYKSSAEVLRIRYQDLQPRV